MWKLPRKIENWQIISLLAMFCIYSNSVSEGQLMTIYLLFDFQASGHFVTASTTLYCMPGIWKTIGIYFVKRVLAFHFSMSYDGYHSQGNACCCILL
jgi:hypothetical protein